MGNAIGIQMVVTGQYGAVSGPGLLDLFAAQNQALADKLAAEIAISVSAAKGIPAPFDQHLGEGVPDSSYGRQQVLNTITALETQADTIVEGAAAFGLTIDTSV